MKLKKNHDIIKKTPRKHKKSRAQIPDCIPLAPNPDREPQPMLKGFIGTVTQEEDLRLW